MGLEDDAAALHSDAWGAKRLLSHGVRRWMSGARAPRETRFQLSE